MSDYAETFQTHRYKIPAVSGKPVLLVPFGDIHLGSPQCAVERWNEFLAWTKGKSNLYCIGMGDYTDALSASERSAITGKVHDSTYEDLEKFYLKRLEEFAKSIAHLKIIGMHEGNHHFKFESGITSTQWLCQRLKTKYLGSVAFTKLSLVLQGKKMVGCTIFSSHGLAGSGKTVYGGMNAVEKMENLAEADLYLQGHNHQKGALPFARLHLAEGHGRMKVVQRKGFYIRTGSFLKAYTPGERSYASQRLYRPTDLGTVEVQLIPLRKHASKNHEVENVSLDIFVSV